MDWKHPVLFFYLSLRPGGADRRGSDSGGTSTGSWTIGTEDLRWQNWSVSMLGGPGVTFRGQIRKAAWWLGGGGA